MPCNLACSQVDAGGERANVTLGQAVSAQPGSWPRVTYRADSAPLFRNDSFEYTVANAEGETATAQVLNCLCRCPSGAWPPFWVRKVLIIRPERAPCLAALTHCSASQVILLPEVTVPVGMEQLAEVDTKEDGMEFLMVRAKPKTLNPKT